MIYWLEIGITGVMKNLFFSPSGYLFRAGTEEGDFILRIKRYNALHNPFQKMVAPCLFFAQFRYNAIQVLTCFFQCLRNKRCFAYVGFELNRCIEIAFADSCSSVREICKRLTNISYQENAKCGTGCGDNEYDADQTPNQLPAR